MNSSSSNVTRITASKITIAGQTAPGDGFGLKNGTVLVSGDDIVIRHMRFRDGDDNLKTETAPSLSARTSCARELMP